MLSLISKRTGERMPTPMLQHMPLTSAYLCQDCNSIGNCARQCPACASEVLMGLAGVLNREVEQVPQSEYSYGPALVA
jgi:ferredoxin